MTAGAQQPTLTGWLIRDVLIGSVLALMLWGLHTLHVQAGATWVVNTAAVLGAVIGFVAAYIGCYIVHEWGHLLGGRAAGAHMPPNGYAGALLGAFDVRAHSTRQFVWLSWGGVMGYLLVASATLLIYVQPGSGWTGAGLAVGGLAFVVQSLSVDVPQIVRVMRGADPLQTNREGASGAVIVRRTWQSWSVLAAALVAWNLAV